MKKAVSSIVKITVLVCLIAALIAGTANLAVAFQEHHVDMFKEAFEGGNIISKDDNVVFIDPWENVDWEWGVDPMENPEWEEDTDGIWYDRVTLNKPIIEIISPEKGEMVTTLDWFEIEAKISCSDLIMWETPEDSPLKNNEINMDSITVKLIDEEGQEFGGDLELTPKHWDWAPEGTQEVEISFTPYDPYELQCGLYRPGELQNGVYTIEVYGEDTNGQSAKRTWKFLINKEKTYVKVCLSGQNWYQSNRLERNCEKGDYNRVRTENWENYVDSGHRYDWEINHLVPETIYVGQSGDSSAVYNKTSEDWDFFFFNEGHSYFGDYSLTEKGYKKAKVRLHVKALSLNGIHFNPFYLEVYIDGVKAGSKLIQESDREKQDFEHIEIPLDIDVVKSGGVIELTTNRLLKENPIPATFPDSYVPGYAEGILFYAYYNCGEYMGRPVACSHI